MTQDEDLEEMRRQLAQWRRSYRSVDRLPRAIEDRVWARIESADANVSPRPRLPQLRFRTATSVPLAVAACLALTVLAGWWWLSDATRLAQLQQNLGLETAAGYLDRTTDQPAGTVDPRKVSPSPMPKIMDGPAANEIPVPLAKPSTQRPAPTPQPAPARPPGRTPVRDRLPQAPKPTSSGPSSPNSSPTPSRVTTRDTGAVAKASTMAAEAKLLAVAQRQLSSGQLDACAAKLRRFAERFPQPMLLEEFAALRTMLACAQPHARTMRQRRAFERRFPQSPLLARVRRACGSKRGLK